MAQVHVSELVLRDGHQSLIATRLRTEDMLPICSKLDAIGFWSLEAWGGATFDTCVRYLKEDPWERLKKLRAALPNSRIQMLLRGQNLLGYRHYSDDVVRAFVKQSADSGVDVFRVFDALNDIRNLRVSIEAVKKHGKHAEGTISYTTSPVHDINYFAEMAKQLDLSTEDAPQPQRVAGVLNGCEIVGAACSWCRSAFRYFEICECLAYSSNTLCVSAVSAQGVQLKGTIPL